MTLAQSAAVFRSGGREYPYQTVAQCRVCKSKDFRKEIEDSILKGYTAPTIARSLPENSNISARNINDHIRNEHLPTDIGVRQVIIEDRAKEIGRALNSGRGSLADQVTMARLAIQHIIEKMARGEMDMDMKDAVALANFLDKVESRAVGEGGDLNQEVINQSFFAYLRAAQSIMSREQFQELGRTLAADPVLKGIKARAESVTIDAESEEDE